MSVFFYFVLPCLTFVILIAVLDFSKHSQCIFLQKKQRSRLSVKWLFYYEYSYNPEIYNNLKFSGSLFKVIFAKTAFFSVVKENNYLPSAGGLYQLTAVTSRLALTKIHYSRKKLLLIGMRKWKIPLRLYHAYMKSKLIIWGDSMHAHFGKFNIPLLTIMKNKQF